MKIRKELLLSLVGTANVALAAQPSAAAPVSAPLRDLPWAQLNILHTTDTHGWHAGHLREPSFSADWGDYISFAEKLHDRADAEGNDLILVDTGDRVEGNGLYDASNPKGKYDLAIFAQQPIDIICSGNHELYRTLSVEYEYNTTVPSFKDNYIASNLDVIPSAKDNPQPLAQRYKKFITKNQGIRILAFGFLFDFTNAAKNVRVQKVEDTIKEKWFQDAIRDREVDLFLVIGHVALRSPELDLIFKAIRSQQWDVPIQILGGHTHIRDYAKYDGKAYALESGRYMETVGFASIEGLKTGGKKESTFLRKLLPRSLATSSISASPKFSRRYIDNNLFSYYYHTASNSSTFSTPSGRNVSQMIAQARKKLDLDRPYGCAPQDYWTARAPFHSNDSIYTLLQDHILPETVQDKHRKEKPHLIFTNTGAIRFDVFKGPFTLGTMYQVSPFTNSFRFIRDVPFSAAKRLLQIMNQEVPELWSAEVARELRALVPAPPSMQISASSSDHFPLVHNFAPAQQIPLALGGKDKDKDLTPGYTTKDDAGNDGDDTLHAPIQFYRVPNCVEIRVGLDSSASQEDQDLQTVDVVYNEFLEKYILLALKFLGTDYEKNSTATYMEGTSMTDAIETWVRKNWKCE